VKLFSVAVIKRKSPRERKHGGVDYLVMAETGEAARKKVYDYLADWERPLHVGIGREMNDEGGPISWIHYTLTPQEVDVRVKRHPMPDPVEAEGLTEATRDPDFSDVPQRP
jgi:hypothetical protein